MCADMASYNVLAGCRDIMDLNCELRTAHVLNLLSSNRTAAYEIMKWGKIEIHCVNTVSAAGPNDSYT